LMVFWNCAYVVQERMMPVMVMDRTRKGRTKRRTL
jgi:hypothetical protein